MFNGGDKETLGRIDKMEGGKKPKSLSLDLKIDRWKAVKNNNDNKFSTLE